MRTRFAIKIHSALERFFPERRVFLKSDTDTRFIRLRPVTQLFVFTGASLFVAWSIVATAVILMDSIGSGNFREQAKRDQRTYQARLSDLSAQRNGRAEEAVAAQERFNAALKQISVMQSELLQSETRRRELETGIEVIQSTLRDTMKDREAARTQVAELEGAAAGEGKATRAANGSSAPISLLAEALERTAAERDQVVIDAQDALIQADELNQKLALMREQNDAIFRQLEEAMTVSVAPLDKMFRSAGMPTDRMLATGSFPRHPARQPSAWPDGQAEHVPHCRAKSALCEPAEILFPLQQPVRLPPRSQNGGPPDAQRDRFRRRYGHAHPLHRRRGCDPRGLELWLRATG